MGIFVCGLNGAGKTTFGKVLADELGYRFIDIEELYFPNSNSYANPRSQEEAWAALAELIEKHGGKFVLTSVTANYSEELASFFDLAVLVCAGREERLARVRRRSAEKFGERILPGGDLYEVESEFFAMVESRGEDYAEKFLRREIDAGRMRCPVVKINGGGSRENLRQSVEENVKLVVRQMMELGLL